MARSRRLEEHTGEVELALEAPTEAELFEEAALALADLIRRWQRGPRERRELSLPPSEPELLLADWLNELVFLAELEGFVPERVLDVVLDESGLQATVEGRLGRPAHLVKAVTLHNLHVAQTGDTWQARVVLDV